MAADRLPGPGDDPIDCLQRWHEVARACEPQDGAACCLATADADGRPSARMVLYRGLNHGRLSFYTNLESRKAQQLRENPHAALVFYWHTLGRQLRVEGEVEPLPAEVSDRYFAGRPRDSQLGAWASPQSRALASREQLEARLHELSQRFAAAPIPRPNFWGGFGLSPQILEFWVQGEHRLHWRRRFTRDGRGWRSELLAP